METLDTFDEVGNELVWVRNLLGIDCLRKEGERRVKWFFLWVKARDRFL